MLELIFPRQIDNKFRGQRLALWLFVPIVVLRLGIGAGSVFNTHEAVVSADGIPLSTFNTAGADTVIALFSLLGLFHLLLGLLGVLALVRYRALVPLLYLLFLVQALSNKLLLLIHPIARAGGQGGSLVALTVLALTVIGLVLCVVGRSDRSASAVKA
jgi:hypothetical protein